MPCPLKRPEQPIDPYKAHPLPLGRPAAVYYRQSSEGQIGNIMTTLQTIDMIEHQLHQGYVRENVAMIDPDDRILVSLSFTLARRESIKLGQRVRGGIHAKMRSGGSGGLAPDGYKNMERRTEQVEKLQFGKYTRWIEIDEDRARAIATYPGSLHCRAGKQKRPVQTRLVAAENVRITFHQVYLIGSHSNLNRLSTSLKISHFLSASNSRAS